MALILGFRLQGTLLGFPAPPVHHICRRHPIFGSQKVVCLLRLEIFGVRAFGGGAVGVWAVGRGARMSALRDPTSLHEAQRIADPHVDPERTLQRSWPYDLLGSRTGNLQF